MSTFKAPVKDQLFTLEAVGERSRVQTLPEREEFTDELAQMILEEVAKFAEDVITPLNLVGDQQGCRVNDGQVEEAEGYKEAYQQYYEAGWVGITGDPEYGGQGQSKLMGAAVSETVMAASLSFALCPTLSQGAISALQQHGSDELKETYLPKLTSGEWTGTMNLTESQAGSDLGLIKTMAEPKEDHYLVKGQKIFITWGDHSMTENIIHLVLARTPGAPDGSRGLSLFLVPKYLLNEDGTCGERNDVYTISVEHKLGIHGSPTCVLGFGENDGAVGYLIGQEYQGLQAMFTMMNHARLEVALQAVGVSERAYQLALAYAQDRVQGNGKRIIEHGDVRRMLFFMKSGIEAGRALCYAALASADFAEHGDSSAQFRMELLTPIAKGWMTEMANEITSQGIQVHGGMGYIEETGAAQFYRDARIVSIYEGTTGIHANDLMFRKLLKNRGTGMAALMQDMEASIAGNDTANDQINKISELFSESAERHKLTTQVILNISADHIESCAYDYLMMTGYVTAAWLLFKKAILADKMSAEEGADQRFLNSKISTALSFCVNLLPRAYAHASTIDLELAQNSSLGAKEDTF